MKCASCGNSIPEAQEKKWGEYEVCGSCYAALAKQIPQRPSPAQSGGGGVLSERPWAEFMEVLKAPVFERPEPKIAPRVVLPEIPDYQGASAVALLLTIIGVIELLIAVMIALNTPSFRDAMMIAVAGVLSCVIFFGLSAIILCIRDAAINSFHIRRLLENRSNP